LGYSTVIVNTSSTIEVVACSRIHQQG